jgi:hypothetical protein
MEYYQDDDDDNEQEEFNQQQGEQQQEQKEAVCCICASADDSRRLCHFRPTADDPSYVVIHLFCGKTAGILPHINRPDLELLTKANLKNKHGSGVSVITALQQARTCTVVDGSRTTQYYMVGEFEKILNRLTKEEQQNQKQKKQQQQQQHHEQYNLPSFLVEDEQDALFFDTNYNGQDLLSNTHQSLTLVPSKKKYANVSPEPTVADSLPPHKKPKPTPPSPYQISMDRLQHVCERELGIGYNVVRGVARASQDGDHDVDDDNFDPHMCSPHQVHHIRIIITTQRRESQKLIMESLLTSSKTHQAAYLEFSKRYLEETLTWPERTDMLLAFTEKLKDLDPWTNDAEWKGQGIISSLAMLWKDALQYRPCDLGLDPEFSYPGVLALLENLRGILKEAGANPPLLFSYSDEEEYVDVDVDHEYDEDGYDYEDHLQ